MSARCWSTRRPATTPRRTGVPRGVRDPGIYRARGDVAETERRSGSRSPRRPTPCSPAARHRRRSSCTWTRGPPTAAASSSTRLAPGKYHSYLCDEVVPWVDAQVPDHPRRPAPGDRGQVKRRVRRDDHADAPPRPVRRAGHARGRRATTSTATSRSSRRRYVICATTTATSSGWWDDFRSRVAFTKPEDLHLISAARRLRVLFRAA